jgi:hypothetical protein
MEEIRKQQIKTAMIEHLTKTVNYPDCDADAILGELKNMWIMLEDKGLTEGLSFKQFVEAAQGQAMMPQMRGIFGL